MRIFILLFLWASIYSNPYSDKVYDAIADITDPTTEEYLAVQEYIFTGTIPHIDQWVDWNGNPWPRRFTIIKNKKKSIYRKINYVNCKRKDPKENCIILYCGFMHSHPEYLSTLRKKIKRSKFKGHLISRLGAMPNMEEGDLRLAHLPHAYKLASIREAVRLGYKKVLWLDCTVIPEFDLNIIFDRLETHKVFGYKSPFNLDILLPKHLSVPIYDITREVTKKYYCVHRSIIGFDLTDDRCLKFIEEWYQTTKNKEAKSFTPYDEISLVSYLLNLYFPDQYFPNAIDHINTSNPDTLEFSVFSFG